MSKEWQNQRIKNNRAIKNKSIVINYFVKFILLSSILIWHYMFFLSPTDMDEFRFAFFSSQTSYIQTIGFIDKSEVVKYREPSYKGESSGYKAKISYSYDVDEEKYSSGELTFYDLNVSTKFSTKNKAERFIDDYTNNKKITVYYDVNKPSFSMILKPEERPSAFILFLLLIILFISALTGFIYLRTKR